MKGDVMEKFSPNLAARMFSDSQPRDTGSILCLGTPALIVVLVSASNAVRLIPRFAAN
jgi:hypothetical protein